MQLERHEYGIGVLHTESGFTDAIVISKSALEEWQDHYLKVSNEYHYNSDNRGFYYAGKADTLFDLLEHFEEE